MKTEKAEALNELIIGSVSLIKAVLDVSKEDLPKLVIPKENYNPEVFAHLFEEFEDELMENILNYNDKTLIFDYLHSCFPEYPFYTNSIYHANKEIIKLKFETEYLLKLKAAVFEYSEEVKNTCNEKSGKLASIFSDVNKGTFMNKNYLECLIEDLMTEEILDDRFIFSQLKINCDSLENTGDKIKFINQRTHDFKQFRLEQSRLYPTKVDEYLNKHYPHFLDLCKIELEKLENDWEIDRKIRDAETPVTRIVNETPFADYSWKATQTDLLELIASLHLCKAIVRRDGKELTRKELVDNFGLLFQIEIKEAESKLGKATDRKSPTASFTHQLQQAFANYCNKENKHTQKKVVKFR